MDLRSTLSEDVIKLLDSALLDCYGRFITLLPEEVLTDHIHLPFHLQETYWWYCDKWRDRNPSLPSFTFSEFIQFICVDCPILQRFVSKNDLKTMITNWRQYKKKIPVRGGIIFNVLCDKVLLVQSYSSKNWSFPRGKIDEAENDRACAVREINEETGLDVNSNINDDVYLELIEDDLNLKLFLIPGIDENQALKQTSSYEISKFKWFPIKQLENKKYLKFGTFHVTPFVKKTLEFARDFQNGKFTAQFPTQYDLYQQALNNKLRMSRIANSETFGSVSRWSPEEMFKVNSEKFGIVSTYKEDETDNFNPFSNWTPVEIGANNKRDKYKDRQLVPFDPNSFF
ncbi:Dcp2 box A domain protein [Theileria parva strain Muguga]|uniref:Nudix hydrolase domain-containing protein n=1 Tax=Theileria parva TaxID=5875 RepID=Q4N0R4_THEPA|nr:Dcp2 box A domain protein [Theileria parva strain Muguga]EAN30785.1 Dcp2 box A domain protein [Theileria parva strain Muguga]|eukprot:XP_763068.1 hypothetical protein [Theileria parva strain Muguga]